MKFSDISVPEIYKSSADFRFFLRWFSESLHRIKYDTENMFDLYDPLRCPSKLLWMLVNSLQSTRTHLLHVDDSQQRKQGRCDACS